MFNRPHRSNLLAFLFLPKAQAAALKPVSVNRFTWLP
jgi:hypothetical protein